ncbi:LADA_0B07800g1_1 [Lachancea dasiensis]|uniref:FAD synthase n=1 Tax=Lachancea dasiensis TaxID=1072105 RepID=A0A1G4IU91_9SACH|nr:LADA_0B07800g1_1 [Lachancea dasiensis]
MTLAEVAERCYHITSSYLASSSDSAIVGSTKEALNLTRRYFLQDVFTQWNPFSKKLSFSYNGGKDCQVLLILYLSCLWEFFAESVGSSQYPAQYHQFPLRFLPTVYINQTETFTTLENSIESTRKRYFLSVYESPQNQTSMPEAFKKFLDVHPQTEAIVIGIRHTDPFGSDLDCVQKTDKNWPTFMRIQPLLHWKLANVWSLLLYSNEEICGLYETGFTSIGSINSTVPNPFLKKSHSDLQNPFQWEIENAFGKRKEDINKVRVSKLSSADVQLFAGCSDDEYYPGWYLVDDSLERAGRS